MHFAKRGDESRAEQRRGEDGKEIEEDNNREQRLGEERRKVDKMRVEEMRGE